LNIAQHVVELHGWTMALAPSDYGGWRSASPATCCRHRQAQRDRVVHVRFFFAAGFPGFVPR